MKPKNALQLALSDITFPDTLIVTGTVDITIGIYLMYGTGPAFLTFGSLALILGIAMSPKRKKT